MKEVGSPLKILTYNIHSGKNIWMQPTLDAIIDYLQSTQGDVVCLQEINENEKRGFQVSKIKNSLQKDCIFAPNVSIGKGHYGLAVFTSLPILEYHHILLPSAKEQRGLLHTVLQVEKQELHVLNTHLGLSKAERARQLEFIDAYISKLKANIILAGDFNTTKPELGSLPLLDVGEIAGKAHIPTFIPNPKRIDLVFISPTVRVVNYQVSDVKLSDHYPIEVSVLI
ncbi:MAG: hypothetical protein GXW85_05030 [Clostridia bacterium]|nr:hypothetical protein [Clostridia bacterium]